MGTSIDWLSAIKRDGPDVPASLRSIISRSDHAFCRKENLDSVATELQNLDSEVSLNLYEYVRLSLGAHNAVLQRELVWALQKNQPIARCFRLFEKLSSAGFASPVEKSRIVVVLLQYLEDKLTSIELRPLVEAMVAELESCRIGCDENLSVLSTFLKTHPDDPTQAKE